MILLILAFSFAESTCVNKYLDNIQFMLSRGFNLGNEMFDAFTRLRGEVGEHPLICKELARFQAKLMESDWTRDNVLESLVGELAFELRTGLGIDLLGFFPFPKEYTQILDISVQLGFQQMLPKVIVMKLKPTEIAELVEVVNALMSENAQYEAMYSDIPFKYLPLEYFLQYFGAKEFRLENLARNLHYTGSELQRTAFHTLPLHVASRLMKSIVRNFDTEAVKNRSFEELMEEISPQNPGLIPLDLEKSLQQLVVFVSNDVHFRNALFSIITSVMFDGDIPSSIIKASVEIWNSKPGMRKQLLFWLLEYKLYHTGKKQIEWLVEFLHLFELSILSYVDLGSIYALPSDLVIILVAFLKDVKALSLSGKELLFCVESIKVESSNRVFEIYLRKKETWLASSKMLIFPPNLAVTEWVHTKTASALCSFVERFFDPLVVGQETLDVIQSLYAGGVDLAIAEWFDHNNRWIETDDFVKSRIIPSRRGHFQMNKPTCHSDHSLKFLYIIKTCMEVFNPPIGSLSTRMVSAFKFSIGGYCCDSESQDLENIIRKLLFVIHQVDGAYDDLVHTVELYEANIS
jgi:hypothetical protein